MASNIDYIRIKNTNTLSIKLYSYAFFKNP